VGGGECLDPRQGKGGAHENPMVIPIDKVRLFDDIKRGNNKQREERENQREEREEIHGIMCTKQKKKGGRKKVYSGKL